jgi:hypothetical protein
MDNEFNEVTRLGILKVVVAFLINVLTMWFVYLNPAYNLGTFLVGIALPLATGCALLSAGRQRVLLFVFLAYFWSLVDDAPVNFDSVLTWPEVTRDNPAAPHYFLEVILHLLTVFFLYLAVRESLKGKAVNSQKNVEIALLTLVAFGLSYLQNAPLGVIRHLITHHWFELDLLEHIASGTFLYFALRIALTPRQDSTCPTIA